MTPLAALSRAYAGRSTKDIPAIAARAGVKPVQAANLLHGRPISADGFLRLALAIGHDPAPKLDQPPGPHFPADLDRVRFALGLRIMRGVRDHDERGAAAAMKVSLATVCRIENAHEVSIGMILRACAYLGSHPFGWLKVPRGTITSPSEIVEIVPRVARETSRQVVEIRT